jgi:hypothetical protein
MRLVAFIQDGLMMQLTQSMMESLQEEICMDFSHFMYSRLMQLISHGLEYLITIHMPLIILYTLTMETNQKLQLSLLEAQLKNGFSLVQNQMMLLLNMKN